MKAYKSIWLNPKGTFEELAELGDKQSLILSPIIVFGISLGLDSSQDLGNVFGNDQKVFWIHIWYTTFHHHSLFDNWFLFCQD